ncbi:MAG: type ISP restriction/modification enzyme, partial [Fimbriimonadales bacterium]
GGRRRENLSARFLEALRLEASPEQVLAYIYAVLHAPLYRARYAEFLRRDFPRIPLPPSREAFEQLAALGQELIQLHLLEHRDLEVPQCKFPVAGDGRVERVRREGEQVWINATQYFEPVPESAWAFRVGGYPVCEKWLSDRKGRVLSFEEVRTYQRIVTALAQTVELQAVIDEVCRKVWGWSSDAELLGTEPIFRSARPPGRN